MSEHFLLMHTPTTEHRVTIDEGHVTLSQSLIFTFDVTEKQELTRFLQAVKDQANVRHTYTGEVYILEYDPTHGELHLFQIIRRTTGRIISMGWSTAGRLRMALTGETDRLVKEAKT
jgi:hypothetical protein